MTSQPSEGKPDDRLWDEVGHRKLGVGGLAQPLWDTGLYDAHGEVLPIRAAKRLHESRVVSAVATDPVMERDYERNLAVPVLTARLAQVAPRLLDRGRDLVQSVEDAQVVEGGGDRHLLLVSGGERRDRPCEVEDAMRVVAVALEGRRVTTRTLTPRIEDLVDERMTYQRGHVWGAM